MTARERIVELGKRYSSDRQLHCSVVAAVNELKEAIPTLQITAGGTPESPHLIYFKFAGREYELKHHFSWTGGGSIQSRIVLSLGDEKNPPRRNVSSLTLGQGGAIFSDNDHATGLTLPKDAAEVVVHLLAFGGSE